jgi:hypothetical protein
LLYYGWNTFTYSTQQMCIIIIKERENQEFSYSDMPGSIQGMLNARQGEYSYFSKFLTPSCTLKRIRHILFPCYYRSVPHWPFIRQTVTLILAYPMYINPLTPELDPSAQRSLTRFFTGDFAFEPWISLIYAWKTNKCNNYHSAS